MKTSHAILIGVSLAAGSLLAAQDPPAAQRPAPPAADRAGGAGEERAIRAMLDAFALAFQKSDAGAIAALFAEDGEAVDADGEAIHGRAALAEHYAARFASNPGDKITATSEGIKFLAPGVAHQTGSTESTPSEGGPALKGHFTAILIKRDDRWLVASLRELPDHENHHERLKELEWLVGDWVEETADAVVMTSVAWTDNKNFLLRSFDVRVKGKPELTGSQRIGWDPLTKQIKSWVFDSRGGYGEGLWMRSGDQWVIKATGVRPNGTVATATQVLTRVAKDQLRWKSIDRTLGSEIASDIDEIVMVRKPPQPK